MSAVLRQRGGSAPRTYLLKLIVAQIQEEEISEGEVGQVSYFLDLVVVEHEVDQGLQTNIQYSGVHLHSGHNIRGGGSGYKSVILHYSAPL